MAHLGLLMCDLAAVVQTSGFDGTAFRRRTSAQGELRDGLSIITPPSSPCVPPHPVPLPEPLIPLPPSRPDATQPAPPVVSSSRRSATPLVAAHCPAPEFFIPKSARAAALPRPASPPVLAPKPIMH